MKKFLLQAFAVAFCLSSGVFVASCDDDNNSVDKRLMWWLPQLVKQVIW